MSSSQREKQYAKFQLSDGIIFNAYYQIVNIEEYLKLQVTSDDIVYEETFSYYTLPKQVQGYFKTIYKTFKFIQDKTPESLELIFEDDSANLKFAYEIIQTDFTINFAISLPKKQKNKYQIALKALKELKQQKDRQFKQLFEDFHRLRQTSIKNKEHLKQIEQKNKQIVIQFRKTVQNEQNVEVQHRKLEQKQNKLDKNIQRFRKKPQEKDGFLVIDESQSGQQQAQLQQLRKQGKSLLLNNKNQLNQARIISQYLQDDSKKIGSQKKQKSFQKQKSVQKQKRREQKSNKKLKNQLPLRNQAVLIESQCQSIQPANYKNPLLHDKSDAMSHSITSNLNRQNLSNREIHSLIKKPEIHPNFESPALQLSHMLGQKVNLSFQHCSHSSQYRVEVRKNKRDLIRVTNDSIFYQLWHCSPITGRQHFAVSLIQYKQNDFNLGIAGKSIKNKQPLLFCQEGIFYSGCLDTFVSGLSLIKNKYKKPERGDKVIVSVDMQQKKVLFFFNQQRIEMFEMPKNMQEECYFYVQTATVDNSIRLL